MVRPDSLPARLPRINPPSTGNNYSPAAPNASSTQRRPHSSRSSRTHIVEGNKMMRNIDRPPPGDPTGSRRSQVHPELSKKRSAYFESEFAAANRDTDPVRARIQNEAIVMADLRTNVIIKDEFSFITDLSYNLSNRYQRPISSIVINLNHGCCMMFGGSFDPAYTLTIHALACLVQPTTNKRNAALIQKHIQETLGVIASRGYVRFVATPEENVSVGGRTIAAEINESGSAVADDKPAETRKSTKSSRRIGVKSFGGFRSASMTDLARVPTPPSSTSDETTPITTIPEVPPTPPEDDTLGELMEQKPIKTAPRRRSLRFGLFSGKTTV
ncbi:Tautomerase/MIF [Daldinia caldariorum]|uniref:Tautomerase/MIF n=1 Tax=Daldinia caldariorum TaxID=326644 RepID=UPI0020080E7F|nr:Tautomerase/MIF [Daldinia caldariorum]KAI1465282.1 Tautomerase/MIF [Daldinia caldariorum]